MYWVYLAGSSCTDNAQAVNMGNNCGISSSVGCVNLGYSSALNAGARCVNLGWISGRYSDNTQTDIINKYMISWLFRVIINSWLTEPLFSNLNSVQSQSQ
jgi:hypothetical protein